MPRSFVRLDGSPQTVAELDAWLRVGPAQLGAVRARHLVPAASAPMAVLLGLVLLLVLGLAGAGLVAAVAGVLPVVAAVIAVAPVAVLLLIAGIALVGQQGRRTIEVREHGLLVGSRPVPFATMDPGRMVWATSSRAGRSVVTLARRRRTAGGECLLLCGSDGLDAVEDWRRLGGKYDPIPRAPRLDSPFVWWVLGPREVAAFVRDLEAAMLADGYPVRGLADHLARSRTDVPTGHEAYPRRAAGDPPLWRG